MLLLGDVDDPRRLGLRPVGLALGVVGACDEHHLLAALDERRAVEVIHLAQQPQRLVEQLLAPRVVLREEV